MWDTRDVSAMEAFDYYREAICDCFMPLRPELEKAARSRFRSTVRTWELPAGALNMVTADSHDVLRTPKEINASPEQAVYVNLALSGSCVIHQDGRSVALGPGAIALFCADTPFTMNHVPRQVLRVASFLLPREALPEAIEPGLVARISDHPIYGAILTEAARALAHAVASEADVALLHRVFLSLVVAALTGTESRGTTSATAQRTRIQALIRANAARQGWQLADCAAELGLSTRQVQRLLAEDGDGFASSLAHARLALAARILRDPAEMHRPVADVALMAGYSDAAPFSRAFRQAYGCSPSEWRRQ